MKKIILYAILSLSLYAHAGVHDFIHSPVVEKGDKEIEMRIGRAKDHEGNIDAVYRFGYGYAPTDNFKIALFGAHHDEEKKHNAVGGFEAIYQFTKTGVNPFEFGILFEIETPDESHAPNQAIMAALFETQISDVLINANLKTTKQYGPNKHLNHSELGYQFQARYLSNKNIDIGLQGFGEFGEWDQWKNSTNQTHRWGPAIFGDYKINEEETLGLSATYLYGATRDALNHTLVIHAEYEF